MMHKIVTIDFYNNNFFFIFFFRLELFTESSQSSVTVQEVERYVQDVWYISSRLSQHTKCLFGGNGAAGVICDHARYILLICMFSFLDRSIYI